MVRDSLELKQNTDTLSSMPSTGKKHQKQTSINNNRKTACESLRKYGLTLELDDNTARNPVARENQNFF